MQLAESNKEQNLLREDLADVRRELEERNASMARSAADEEAQLRKHEKEKVMMKKMAEEVLRLRAEAVKKDDLARLAIASIKQQQAKLALPEVVAALQAHNTAATAGATGGVTAESLEAAQADDERSKLARELLEKTERVQQLEAECAELRERSAAHNVELTKKDEQLKRAVHMAQKSRSDSAAKQRKMVSTAARLAKVLHSLPFLLLSLSAAMRLSTPNIGNLLGHSQKGLEQVRGTGSTKLQEVMARVAAGKGGVGGGGSVADGSGGGRPSTTGGRRPVRRDTRCCVCPSVSALLHGTLKDISCTVSSGRPLALQNSACCLVG